MPLEPNERFHRDLADAQGNFAMRNQEQMGRRVIDAMGSKNFRTPAFMRTAFAILGMMISLTGIAGIWLAIWNGKALSGSGNSINVYVFLFGIALLGWGIALILSSRRP